MITAPAPKFSPLTGREFSRRLRNPRHAEGQYLAFDGSSWWHVEYVGFGQGWKLTQDVFNPSGHPDFVPCDASGLVWT